MQKNANNLLIPLKKLFLDKFQIEENKKKEIRKNIIEILKNHWKMFFLKVRWCQGGDLNSRPPAYETSALAS